ncbi:class I SAM-dependent methyltransferase [Aliarcobacter butzleri]|uniref:class I SAM-dependent methyltransferase n=1 Tax=Aliarcobacter butzleri TaxID=28197 RepID=UPI00065A4DFD|nr:class I SAM-dependent methyltransferase [Aliarcobacter butzleri]KLE04775.1 SAM-dependent methyltransferase [Aliarcobacter butzleri L353]MCG3713153.1 class I SAM-dependent methyltransferase [Aliarcobacter butzleri]
MMKILEDIDSYYTSKIKEFGSTPKGVDWNGENSQFTRFIQVSKIINSNSFSINDIGCGYGKYFEYLKKNFQSFTYTGYDLSEEMIKNANTLYKNTEANFIKIENLSQIKQADYSIASGIFGVKMQYNKTQWLSYILTTLEKMNEKSSKGFAFNMLTMYSDKEYMKDNLYYADPLFIFDYCKKNFSKQVSLLHDYGIYEFTILLRKDI